jgi:hypothetical protein
MNKHNIPAAAFVAALFVTVAASAASPLNPGRWEVTIKTEAPVAMPATTSEICITAEMAEHPEPKKSKTTDECQVIGLAMQGGVLTYDTQCSKKKVSSKAKFTYSGETYTGIVTIKSGDMEVRQVHTARRLGTCETAGQ